MNLRMTIERPDEPVQATAAVPCSLSRLANSLLPGFVLAQRPAAVPDFFR